MRLAGALALLVPTLSLGAAPASAQGPPDTVTVDPARQRVLDRLRALAKPPGLDSTLMRDTLQAQRLREASRRDGPPPTDSVMAALLELAGYNTTRYEGSVARFRAGSERLVLEGAEGAPARLQQTAMTLTAVDTITFDQQRELVWTAGETVTDRPGEEPVTSENIIYSLQEDRGSAEGAKTSFSQGATWLMEGDLPHIVPDTIFGHRVIFTSCQEDEPHYHFAAREVKTIGGEWMVVRNVTLNFADVPVLWLPFIFQNTGSGRSSGILTPRFSINDVVRTSRGQTRRLSNVGFFWAIDDYSDATLALDWWSDNFVSVTGGFRYNVLRQFLNGQLNYRQFWRSGGGRQTTFDTRHRWELSERTRFAASARYASSASFVRENSFDPREVTQSIDSEGGVNHRFDWGTLSLNANRRQFLSDDRVEMTLPQLNLSLKTITLFTAPESRARFYNNMTWSGSASARRSTSDRPEQPAGEEFSLNNADQVNTNGSVSSGLNLGALSWSQSVSFSEVRQLDVPLGVIDSTLVGQGVDDVASANLNWSMGLNYQQKLVGSTTLTPTLTIDGSAKRDDRIEEARSFVSAPTRVSFGAQLRSDLYGFWGGFGPFEAIRHKLSPAFSYQYAPGVVPTDLQETVFGSTELQPRNVLSLTLSQTFEAKRREQEVVGDATSDPALAVDSLTAERVAADSGLAVEPRPAAPGEPTRRQDASSIVNLLSIRTSAVTYDFQRAKEEGARFVDGFRTTRLQNQVGSDFLRGLSLTMEHDLFDTDEEGKRSFDMHLSQLNFGFQMSNRSGIVRTLSRLLGGGAGTDEAQAGRPAPEEPPDEDLLLDDPSSVSLTDESTIVPGAGGNDVFGRDAAGRRPRRRAGVGQWTAGFQYSLSRPRSETQESVQMLQGNLRFQPTENWSMSWRTAYDVNRRAFNDHAIRLTRDLHRWEANFDFLQTATGNWTFRFAVSLTDNTDLKLDYEQRNRDQQGSVF